MSETVNLLPAEFVVQRQVRKRLFAWLTVGIALLAVEILVSYSVALRVKKVETSLEPLREAISGMKGWGEKLAPMTDQLETALERQHLVNGLLVEPFWSEILSDLTQAAPESFWIQEFDVRRDQRTIAENDQESLVDVYEMTISGQVGSSEDLILFLTTFSASEHVTSLTLTMSRMSTEKDSSNRRDFQIVGTVK